jgi:hypothetical protein
MSLNIRRLVKKISAVFKDDEPLPTPNITLSWYSPVRLPSLPFIPIFKVMKDLPPSVEIENLEQQMVCVDRLIDLIDMICEEDLPISWDYKQHRQP